MRILITGSRTWTDRNAIYDVLDKIYYETRGHTVPTIVHGACPRGADAIASDWVRVTRKPGWTIGEERHPADWHLYGKAAGPRRNAEMVNAGADICLAFIKGNSRGATGCADLAEKAGIRTVRHQLAEEAR